MVQARLIEDTIIVQQSSDRLIAEENLLLGWQSTILLKFHLLSELSIMVLNQCEAAPSSSGRSGSRSARLVARVIAQCAVHTPKCVSVLLLRSPVPALLRYSEV